MNSLEGDVDDGWYIERYNFGRKVSHGVRVEFLENMDTIMNQSPYIVSSMLSMMFPGDHRPHHQQVQEDPTTRISRQVYCRVD